MFVYRYLTALGLKTFLSELREVSFVAFIVGVVTPRFSPHQLSMRTRLTGSALPGSCWFSRTPRVFVSHQPQLITRCFDRPFKQAFIFTSLFPDPPFTRSSSFLFAPPKWWPLRHLFLAFALLKKTYMGVFFFVIETNLTFMQSLAFCLLSHELLKEMFFGAFGKRASAMLVCLVTILNENLLIMYNPLFSFCKPVK